MAWTNSKIFVEFPHTAFEGAMTGLNLATNIPKVALYNNTTAPDNTVSAANSAYAVGQWVVGNELTDAGGWPAGGRVLAGYTSTVSTTTYKYDADDTVSADAHTTLTAVYGCLVYDDTVTSVADQGLCYNYFGGSQTVTEGTFTVSN